MKKRKSGQPALDSITVASVERRSERTGHRIVVKHPTYGEYEALNVKDKLQAVQGAAKKWGMQWSTIARECTFLEGESE